MRLITAETIKSQLTNKTLYMLGAYDVLGTENSLSFKIKGSKKFRHIEITLNSHDLYDISFTQWRKDNITNQITIKDVYVDQLHSTIEKNTGLYTKLF